MSQIKAELIDSMGDDLRVVNAARVSFDKVSEEFTYRTDNPKGSDEGLVEYLATHDHFTPFTHPQITIRETVPIFVARQRFKHVVGFTYNEVSRRYVDDEPEFYVPDVWRSRPEGSAKQGSGTKEVKSCIAGYYHNSGEPYEGKVEDIYEDAWQASLQVYKSLLTAGVAPEQARMVLPQSMMTSYYVTGSLAAFARAYNQRKDSHAQKEIQDLTVQWDELIRPLFPNCWEVLTNA